MASVLGGRGYATRNPETPGCRHAQVFRDPAAQWLAAQGSDERYIQRYIRKMTKHSELFWKVNVEKAEQINIFSGNKRL